MTLSLKEPLGVKRGLPRSLIGAIMLILFIAGIALGYLWSEKSAHCQVNYCLTWDAKTHDFVRRVNGN
jgi:hypothetical protein